MASNVSKISMEGWWMVTITVRPLRDTFLTACITMTAARASRPLVGSSMKTTDGLATISTPAPQATQVGNRGIRDCVDTYHMPSHADGVSQDGHMLVGRRGEPFRT